MPNGTATVSGVEFVFLKDFDVTTQSSGLNSLSTGHDQDIFDLKPDLDHSLIGHPVYSWTPTALFVGHSKQPMVILVSEHFFERVVQDTLANLR